MTTSTTPTRLLPHLLTLAVFSLLFGMLSDHATAGPEPKTTAAAKAERTYAPVMPAKEHARRLSLLRRQAQDWHFQRKSLVKRCHHCNGTGRVGGSTRRRGRDSVGLGTTFTNCPTCLGDGRYISKKSFMKVNFSLRSPAFRAAKNRKAELLALHDKAQRGDAQITKLSRYFYQHGELIDAEHAVAVHRYDRSRAPASTKWIWRSDHGRRATWYAYTASADGAWPKPPMTLTAAVEAARNAPRWRRLSNSKRRAAERALKRVGIDAARFQLERRAGALRLRNKHVADSLTRADATRIAAESVQALAGLHAAGLGYADITLEWRMPMTSAAGAHSVKVGLAASLSRAAFEQASFAELAPQEQASRIAFRIVRHEGHELVRAGE